MSELFPGLGETDLDAFVAILEAQAEGAPRLRRLLSYFARLVDMAAPKKMLVVGCGPRPMTLRFLKQEGHEAIGVEPVPSFVASACEWLGAHDAVLQGAAESIPRPDDSCDFLFFESVLEHVDSPRAALCEIHRVLAPGGAAFVVTTNRTKLRLSGYNGEYNVPFFNFFPALVRESYVHKHLHFTPHLANHTTRPAVHWFTFGQLCRLGRDAGFAHFYSLLDLLRPQDEAVRKSVVRRLLLRPLQQNPWLRALALTQVGGAVVMVKRR